VKLSQRRLARPSLGGLLATRQGSLTLALLCAVCAAGVLMFALGRYKTSLKPTVQQATVLVSSGVIKKGTSGQQIAAQRLYKTTPVVSTQVVPGALSDAGAIVGQTAAVDILPGQQLTAADFSRLAGLDQTLTKNERAVAVTIGESPGITDALQPGSRVDVYSLFTPKSGAPELVLLNPNAEVLKAATAIPITSGGQKIVGSSMLLALDRNKTNQVIFSALQGTLYLSLRPLNSSQTPAYATNLQSVLKDNNGFVFGPAASPSSTTSGATPSAGLTTSGATPSPTSTTNGANP
jgi:Flp pilus assembly protein CpaB